MVILNINKFPHLTKAIFNIFKEKLNISTLIDQKIIFSSYNK